VKYSPLERPCRVRIGDDESFWVRRFEVSEGVSRLFRIVLDLVADEEEIAFDRIVGREVRVDLSLPEGQGQRYWCGIVSGFSHLGPYHKGHAGDPMHAYRAVVRPKLWTLSRTSDCRIFHRKTVPEIVAQVLQQHGITDVDLTNLPNDYATREYTVQYREKDLDFLSRLLEAEGISYHFVHDEQTHLLRFFESALGNPAVQGDDTAVLSSLGNVDQHPLVLDSFDATQETSSGRHTYADYNFDSPSLRIEGSAQSVLDIGGNSEYEIYDYVTRNSSIAAAERRARLAAERSEVEAQEFVGRCHHPTIAAGAHLRLDHDGSRFHERRFLITSVKHRLRQPVHHDETRCVYGNTFRCVPLDLPFRPAQVTPRPAIHGIQTALVVGPESEEIHVDARGRIQVQFHWDRENERDGTNVCWARVMQIATGKGFGAVFTPRVGQEVVVSFLDGDPDQPIVTGTVYNGEHRMPFGNEDSRTRSGIRTHSVGGGPQNFNELRFDDDPGNEEVYLHAERDQNVVVEHDRGDRVGNDELREVVHDRRRRVGNDEVVDVTNDQIVTLGNDRFVTIANNDTLEAGNQITLRAGQASITLEANGTLMIDGVDVYVNGKYVSLRGTDSFTYNSDAIVGEAQSAHEIRGASVKHNVD